MANNATNLTCPTLRDLQVRRGVCVNSASAATVKQPDDIFRAKFRLL